MSNANEGLAHTHSMAPGPRSWARSWATRPFSGRERRPGQIWSIRLFEWRGGFGCASGSELMAYVGFAYEGCLPVDEKKESKG